MDKNKRILFLDYARIFTAFLVVYGHLYPPGSGVRLYIYAFHMPLFFLISGFLHAPKTSKEELLKYFRTIFVPILFFILVGVLVRVLFFHGSLVDILHTTLIGSLSHGKVSANSIVWFLFALLNVKIMMFFYLKMMEKRPMSVKRLFLLVMIWSALTYFCRYVPFNPLFLKNALMAFPFFVFGFYVRRYYEKVDFQTPNHWKSLAFALLCAILCVVMTRLNGRVSMYVVDFGNARFPFSVPLFYLNGVVGSLMIVFISFLFTKGNRLVSIAANSLISILGFQAPILDVLGYWPVSSRYLLSVLVSVLVMVACIVLHQIVVKICPELLGKRR